MKSGGVGLMSCGSFFEPRAAARGECRVDSSIVLREGTYLSHGAALALSGKTPPESWVSGNPDLPFYPFDQLCFSIVRDLDFFSVF
jgi:hypothetical protein